MQKHVQKLLLMVAMMVVPWVTQAQGVQGCTFSTEVDTSAWITLSSSATHITAIEGEDDESSGCINIGFDFYFGGFTYTQFSCNSNGRFRLGPVAVSNYWVPPFTTLTDASNNDLPFITAFGMDNTLEAMGSYVKYELVGTTPNRILVVEYLTPSEYSDMGDLVNYQIQLFEDSNRVRLVYGANNATYFDEFQIGLAGSATDILMVNPSTHSTFTTGTSTTFDSWPGVGRYYQFVMGFPPTCPSVIGIDVDAVTVGAAMLSWNIGSGNPASYEIEYYQQGSTATPTTLTSTTPSVMLTGLDSNTTYVVRVRANCGTDGYGFWDSTTFTTNSFGCLNEHNFVSGTGTSQTSGVPVNSGWGNTLCQSIYLASELIAAGFSSAGGDITDLTFTWTNNSSYAKYFTIYLTNTNTSEFTSASSSYWVSTGTSAKVYEGAHPLNTSGSVTYHLTTPFHWDGHSNLCITTTMNQPTGSSHSSSGFYGLSTATSPSVYRTMYKYQDSSPLDGSNPSSISPSSRSYNRPNVTITSADCSAHATCAAPMVTVDSVDTASVSLSWIPGYQETSWDVQYAVRGTTTWMSAGTATTTNATITGLTPATYYNIRVLTICSTDTFYSSVVTAATSCVPIAHSALPYTYGFEDLSETTSGAPLALCWSRGYWSGSYNANSYPYASSTNHTGSRSLYFYGYGTTTRSWVCLPEFEDSINSLRLRFWAKKSSASYSGLMQVGVMTDPTDWSTFQPVATEQTDYTTNWQQIEVAMNHAPAEGLITIAVVSDNSLSNYMYVDDITVDELPYCIMPVVDSVVATTTTADFYLSDVDNAASFTLEIEHGSWDTTITASASPISVMDLNPRTEYTYSLVANCGSSNASPRTGSFRTECSPITNEELPFTYGFEDIAATGSGIPLAPCWSRGYLSGSSFNAMSYPYASTSYAHSGSKALYYYAYSTTTRSWVCLPEFEDSINTLQLQFWAKRSSDSYSGEIKVGVMTDPSDITTFQLVQTLAATDGTNWSRFDLPLSGAPGTGYITLLVEAGNTTYNYIYLDDIEVKEIPSCPHVWNVALDSVSVDWAAISWHEMGTANTWVVEYDTVDFVPGTYTAANSEMVYDTVLLLTNLDTGHTYYFYVRADCGSDTSTYESLEFTTLAGLPATVPYLCSFEGSGTNGWDFANGTQTNHWMVGNATGNGGRSLYITNDDISNTYTISTTSNVYAYRVFSITDTGEYVYSFDWKAHGESCCDYMRAALMPGTFEPVAGSTTGWTQSTGTAVTGAVADLTHNSRLNTGTTGWTSNTWMTVSGTFNITTPGIYKMVFFWHNDGSVGTMPPAAVDNIQLAHNTCPQPTNVTASYVGSTQVTLTWSPGGSETQWQVVGGTLDDDVFDTTYTFTGLQPDTYYSLGVRAVCGGDDTSMAATVNVLTDCGAMSVFPFVEDFENQTTTSSTTANGTFIRCWHHLNNGTSYMGYPYIANSSTYNHTSGGTMGLYWYATTTTGTYGDYYYIVLPAVDTDLVMMNTMRLRFWAKASSTSYHPVFNVGVMTDPTDVTTFQTVNTINVNPGSSTTWAEFTTEFTDFEGVGSYIAIRALRPSSTWYAYMDDIMLDQRPDCPEPTNMAALHITTETADLTWTEAGEATGWEIEYGEHGFTRGTGVSESVGTLPHSILGLTPNTLYDVYVTPECSGVAGTSMFSFRTECVAMGTLPFTMGFETSDGVSTTGGSTSPTFVSCWHRLNNGSDYYGYPYVGSSSTYNHTPGGSRGLYWYNTTTTGTYGDYQVVVLPAVDTDNYAISTLRLSFWASISSGTPTFQVGVMSDPNDITTFHNAHTVTVTSATWRKYNTYFDNFTGTGNYIAIRANRASWTAYVDDITLEVAPTCPEVSDLAASNITTTTANINWVENGVAESWNLEYGLHGFTPGTGTSMTVTSRPAALTGLTANTEYDVYVTPDCVGTTGAESFTFRTECVPNTTIPFTMGFESSEGVNTGGSTNAAFIECWHRLNNGAQYFGYPYVSSSSTYNHTPGGSRGLYWYNTTTTVTYGDYQIVVLPAVDPTTNPINTLQLRFWAKASSSSYHPVFMIGVMTDPNNASTFQQVGTVDVGNNTEWTEFTTGLAGYTGTGMYVAIRANRPGSSWYAYVDDITLEEAPACPQVIDIAAASTGTTGVHLRWSTQAGFRATPSQYEIQVVPDDTSETFLPITTANNPYLLTGLLPGHSYSVRIRGNCDSDGDGAWSEYYDFSTNSLGCGVVDTTASHSDTIAGGTTTTYNIPVNNYYNNTFSEQIYLGSELGGSGPIIAISFDYAYSSPSTMKNNCSIYLANTTLSTVNTTTYEAPENMTLVYTGPMNCSMGWNRFEFNQNPFTYSGGNLAVAVVDNSGSYNSSSYVFNAHSASGLAMSWYSDSYQYPNSSMSKTTHAYRSNAIFDIQSCLQTATCAPPLVVVDSIDTNYIAINWAPGYEETSWDVEYRVAGGTWTNEGTVYTPGYIFTGLTPNQEYEIRITAQCTDTNMATTITATTPCVATPLPFFTSFEDFPGSSASYSMPSCWKRVSNYYPYYPYSSSSYRVSGTYGVYMYSTSSTYSYFTLPPFEAAVDSLVADFWLLKTNTSYPHNIKVGVMTDPDDVSTFTEVATIASPSQIYEWGHYEVYFDSYTGNGRYIAFMSPNFEYSYPYLDDLTIDRIPNCRRVQNVTVSNLTTTGAHISWNAGEAVDFDVVCVPTGTDPDSGIIYQVYSEDSVTVTGLRPGTAYTAYVRGYCYPDTSQWSLGTNFRTVCGLIDTLPFFENFEAANTTTSSSTDFVPCWTRLTDASSYYYPYVSNSTSYSHSGGNKGLYWYVTNSSGYGTYQYVILPPVDTSVYPINTLQFSVWVKSSSTSYSPVFEVGVMNNNTDTAFTRLRTFEINGSNNTNWQQLVVPLSRYTGSGNYVALRAKYISSYWYAYVDEFRLDTLPACPQPLEIVLDSVGTDYISLAWIPSGSETQWRVSVNGVDTIVSDTVLNLTGLTSNTLYHIGVRAICGPGSLSEETTISARTACRDINVLPWHDDLETYSSTSSNSPDFIPCWNKITDATTYYYPYLSSSTTYSHGGGTMGIYWYCPSPSSSYGYYQMVALPVIDTTVLQMNTLQLAFWAKQSTNTPTLIVGVMKDNDATTFVALDTVSFSVNDWRLFEVPATNYTGHGNRFALRAEYSLTNNYWYGYVDDFFIEPISPCPRPDSLQASNATSNSVELSWHETGEATNWVIEYGPRGFQPGTGTEISVSTNPFILTGLPSSYDGDFYVRSLCNYGDTGFYNRIPGLFSTAQAPATIPYYYNFEDSTEWNAWQTNSNTYINWARGTAEVDSGNYAMYISPNGGVTYGNENFSSIVNAAAFRDIDFGTVDTSFTLTYRAKVGGTTTARYDGLMVFLVDPAVPVVASSSGITSPWGNVNDLYRISLVYLDTTWNTYTASFDTIHGVKRVAFFWFNQNTGSGSPYIGGPAAVDNIRIDMSSCPRPVNLDTMAVTNTTATLHWDGAVAANYRVAYRVAGAPASTNLYVTSSTNSVTLTGLDPMTSYRAWVQKLCGSDSSLFSDGIEFQTDMCEDATNIYNFDSSMAVTTSSYGPIGYATYNYSYVQTIIDSAHMAGFTDPITAFAFYANNTTSSSYYTGMDVYMANVPENDLSSGMILPNSTTHQFVQVISNADFSFTDVGWQLHGFDTTFTWDGHSNVLFAVNRHHGSWSSSTSFAAHSTSTMRSRWVYQDSGPISITNAAADYNGNGNYVGDLKFISCGSVPTCHEPIITGVSHTYESGTVTWTGDGTDYEVNIKESSASDWPATDIHVTGNTYTFTGLMPVTAYTIRVRQDCTADTLGYSDWVTDGFTTDSLPCLAPDSLHVTAVTNATATFDWTPVGAETAWNLHVWFSGGLDSVYTVTSHPATVSGFTANTTYQATIRALCGVSNNVVGDWGDTISFTTAVCPDVTGLTTSGVTTNSVTVSWNADPLAVSWIIEYGYHGFDQGTGTTIPTTLTSYTITGLLDDMQYDFRVRAVCGTDWMSEGWANATATTQAGGVPCEAPTNVNAVVAGNSATISWALNTGNISYELEYGTRGFGLGSGTTVNATSSPVTLNNLDYETDYDVYVKAICDQNTYSAWSTVVSFTTEAQGSEDCDPVTDLTANNVTESSALLTWTPGATGDEWEVVLTTAAGATVSEASTTEHQYALSGLTPGTAYVAKVRTVCGDGVYSTFASTSFTTVTIGIDGVAEPACTIYPNPTSSTTTITVAGVSGKVKIAVIDMNGREVASETLDCSGDCAKSIDVENLSQGAYFVRITGENVSMVKKLIVR